MPIKEVLYFAYLIFLAFLLTPAAIVVALTILSSYLYDKMEERKYGMGYQRPW